MDVTSKLQSFIAQYTGVTNVGDTPQNLGQCVGLIEKWLDEFQLPHVWGNAFELLTNADKTAYTIITNTPTNSPSPGDIFVFGPSYGGGFGHTGVVTTSDVNTVTLFQQNDPIGHTPQIKTYNYNGALGWIHPNIFTPTVNQTVTDQQSTDLLNKQIEATAACQNQLKSANDTITSLQDQQQKDRDLIESLQGKLSDANSEINTLQHQLDGEQKEIVNLNQTIETQAQSNKNYGQETLDLTHDNKDLTNYLYAIADKLGITRTGKVNADITEAILTKLDELDMLLKAANLTEGILHSMAKTLQLDDPKATDKDIADRIIGYVKSLQGRLQSLRPQQTQQIEQVVQSPSFWSKLIGFFWQSKT